MHATDLHPDTLHRLSELHAEGHAVLSVYVDLDASRFPTPAARDTELRALLSQARREAEAAGIASNSEIDGDIGRL